VSRISRRIVFALVLAVSSSAPAFAENPPGDPFRDFIATVRAKITGVFSKLEKFEIEYAQSVFDRAGDFQDDYRGKTNFDLKTAELLADDLDAIASRMPIGARVKSQAFLMLAGVDGKIAEKLGRPSGMSRGQAAFRALRTALELDPGSKDAARSYGMTIQGFWEQNGANRFFIERGLDIDLKTEARAARDALERTGMTGEPCYAELGKRLN
jgi:hypothetical protein